MAALVGPNDCTAGYMGEANAIRPYTDAKKWTGFYTKNRFGARNLGSFRLRKRMGEDGLYPYGD